MLRILAAAIVAAPLSAAAATSTVFFDDFEVEDTSPPIVADKNFNGFANWTVTDGTVDLFTDDGFGLPCPSFACVDLDGSTRDAGRMTTKTAFDFMAGVTYTIDINIAGNQRSGQDFVEFGAGAAAITIVFDSGQGYGVVGFPFTPAIGFSAPFFIENYQAMGASPGDNVGPLLDWVRITATTSMPAIPLPAAAPLLLGGLAALGFVGRCRG